MSINNLKITEKNSYYQVVLQTYPHMVGLKKKIFGRFTYIHCFCFHYLMVFNPELPSKKVKVYNNTPSIQLSEKFAQLMRKYKSYKSLSYANPLGFAFCR